jgi:hypothetical protein
MYKLYASAGVPPTGSAGSLCSPAFVTRMRNVKGGAPMPKYRADSTRAMSR